MFQLNRRTLLASRFYTLAEAEQEVAIHPQDLLRLGAAGLLTLCTLLPNGRRAYSVDPDSLELHDSEILTEKHLRRAQPDETHGMPTRKDDLVALILSPSDCQKIEDYGFSKQQLFRSGYAVTGERSLAGPADPVRIRPSRLPLFQKDGSPTDQSTARYALYQSRTRFTYSEGIGYPEPEDLNVTPATVRVLGRELARLPAPRDLTPIIDAEFTVVIGEATPTGEAKSEVKLDSVVENEVSASTPDTTATDRSTRKRVSKKRHGSESSSDSSDHRNGPSVSENETAQGSASADGEERIFLLSREDLEVRLKKGKSWIYERINPKHPRYDPTFPMPIEIGGSIGWIRAEVDAWLRAQKDKSRRA